MQVTPSRAGRSNPHGLRGAWRRGARLAWACALVCGLAAGCDRTSIEPEALLDPASCASCHPEHYEQSGGQHARLQQRQSGVHRPGPLRSAHHQRRARQPVRRLPHAPTAVAVGATVDGADMAEVPRYLHGVGCTACHTIDAVTALHNGGLHRADGVMRGGIGNPVATPAHGSVRSKLLAGAYDEFVRGLRRLPPRTSGSATPQ